MWRLTILEAWGRSSVTCRQEQSAAWFVRYLLGNFELRVEGAFVWYQCFCVTPPLGLEFWLPRWHCKKDVFVGPNFLQFREIIWSKKKVGGGRQPFRLPEKNRERIKLPFTSLGIDYTCCPSADASSATVGVVMMVHWRFTNVALWALGLHS